MTSQTSSTSDSEQTRLLASVCLELVRARFGAIKGPIHLPQNLDIQSLIEFACRHGAATALADGIRKSGVEGAYALGLRMMLEAVEQSTAKRNARMKTVLADVGTRLAAEGIACVALKGGAFIAEDEEAAGWRTASDLDLLVPQDKLHQAVTVLQQGDFVMGWQEDLYRQEDHQHFPAMLCPRTGVSLELHTRAIWDPGRDPLDAKEVFIQARTVHSLPGMLIPSPAHRLIHLIAHCQISDKFYPARKILLKDVIDLAMLCSHEEIDWKLVETAYQNIGRLPELTGFLQACQMLLGPVASHMPLDLAGGKDWAHRAIANYQADTSNRNMMALDIVRDYVGRILLRRGGIALLLTTLLSRDRIRSLFKTHYKKWRS